MRGSLCKSTKLIKEKYDQGRTKKKQIDELMRQYDNEEIDGNTYARKMMELTTSLSGKISEC